MLKDLLTIVIPCKNEKEVVKKTLNLINKQDGIKDVNVIVADCSNDYGITKKYINSEKNKNININIIKGGLPALGRNVGAKLCKTKYILFLDADIFLEKKDIIINVVNEIESKNFSLLTCKIRVDSNKKYNIAYFLFDLIRKAIKIKASFALGGFMLFNLSDFNKVGRFNELDKFAEDFHLSSKINHKKFRISKEKVYTTPRRFENKGILYMAKVMCMTWLYKNNDEFYKKEHKYWS